MLSKKYDFTAPLEDKVSAIWGHHVTVPPEIRDVFLTGKDKRVICTLNKLHRYHCALIGKGDGDYYITVNGEARKKFRLQVGDILQISIEKDTSEYGMPIPPEMRELLEQDDEGSKVFHALTPGKQRSLLYIINKPKSNQLKLRKALVVINFLKYNNGQLDFKALNEAFKADNKK